MTDKEFSDYMKSLPREQSPEEVERHEHERDVERGPYVAHHHHPYFEESRH